MTRSNALLECVCNFSEGRNEATINAIAHSISCIPHQYLLHVDSSPSANRTVMTFAGAPEAVAEATFQAIKIAGGLIDMHLQHGAHPRIGSTDVCPFIPLAHMSMEAAIAISKATAARIAQDLEIPSYLYEYSALLPHRKTLPQIRKGQYEGLHAKMQLPEWKPDYGDTISWDKVSRTGATVIGARKILVAFNISLNTKDISIAQKIAKAMRSSGGGTLSYLRAIGWYMEEYDCVQVSMNLLDYTTTSPTMVWNLCKNLAAMQGVEAIGCEVIGLIPKQCILEAGHAYYRDKLSAVSNLEEDILEKGIAYLQLNAVKPFEPKEKILELNLAQHGLIM